MTALPPLPDFVSYSAASLPSAAAAQAAAPTTPPGAAADLSPSNEGGHQGAPAAFANPLVAGVTDRLGSNISDVGELFHFARLLCAQARIHPGTISPAAVAVAEEIKALEATYYDPPPLFLRTPGGMLQVLRR